MFWVQTAISGALTVGERTRGSERDCPTGTGGANPCSALLTQFYY